MKLYTIGFAQKGAEVFFGLLRASGVRRLVDIRVSPQGQLAGFARQGDLPYFLRELADGCQYTYLPILTPTKEMMHAYRSQRDWQDYAARFEALMDARGVPAVLDRAVFEHSACCLLCSEATPEHCHRSLVAARLAAAWGDVEIVHL